MTTFSRTLFVLLALFAASCTKLRQLDDTALEIQNSVPANAVIAHRGLPYLAPEETAPSYRLALQIGVDYLEADIQRTKGGVLICLHDEDLLRTTDVKTVFPNRKEDPVSEFTLSELRQLDAGSWFNKSFPDRQKPAFAGLKVLTLEELIDLVEASPKPWPGLCLETKGSSVVRGHRSRPSTVCSRNVAGDGTDPDRRLLLQTFERSSLPLLSQHFPSVPTILLLWKGEGYMERADEAELVAWLNFGVDNGAQFVGPSISRPSNDYFDLMQDWMVALMREAGFRIHAYTLNDEFELYVGKTDGLFTDRSDLLEQYYRDK